MTIMPSLTSARTVESVALTTKSVPRTPIAAIGVFNLNRWRAALAA